MHWLSALREDLGLDQEQMCREVGVSRGRISQIENSGGTLANERVLAVWRKHQRRLKRLGYSLDDLLTARPDSPGAAA
jgi:transcriptional regulator with XRE-family HTH domain